jgi:uncharacterized membrane protein YeaQ/YmgE (transglycosylase-associated protein family)
MNIIYWLLVGLVAGGIARLVVPGPAKLGCLGTVLLGLVGSLVGGYLGYLLDQQRRRFSPAGLLGSIIGAILVLALFRLLSRRGGYMGRWRW